MKIRKITDEYRNNMSLGQRKITPKTCPYCGKSSTHNMKRSHFDNCLQNPNCTRKPDFKSGLWKGYVIAIDNTNTVHLYESASDAARQLKMDVHTVLDCIKYDKSVKRGYYTGWKFQINNK